MATGLGILTGEAELQKRADLALSSLTMGGLLAPEVFDRFLQIAQNATPLLAAARVVPMKSYETHIPKIIFTGRMMHATPGDNAAVTSGNRSAPTTSEVLLSAQEYVGEVYLPDRVMQDNVEKEKLETAILELMAGRWAIDMETFAIQGDTLSADPDLVLQDGWTKRITSNVVNAANAGISATILKRARAAVPLKFRQAARAAKKPHVFYTTDQQANDWLDAVGQRVGSVAEKHFLEGGTPPFAGHAIEPCAQIAIAGTPAVGTALFTTPQNLIMGVWREMRIEPWRDAPNRRWTLVITSRVAFAVEQEDAASKVTNLLSA